MKVVDENIRQLLEKVLYLWHKQIFMYIDEVLATNWTCPKFLSLLMTGIIRIGVTERIVSKKFLKRCISRSSKAVHSIKLPLTYSEFTVHMQNQLKAGSFLGTKAGLSHNVFCAMKWTILRWPYKFNARVNLARFLLYLNKPSIALVIELERCYVTFWLTSWT